MIRELNGATRVYFIIGDPIAQVKSPAGVTAAFADKGLNAIVVPIHVKSYDLPGFMEVAVKLENVDGIIVTVPHKFSAYEFCTTATSRADFLTAANTIRRNADGTWHGDMCDGQGHLSAMVNAGCKPAGKRALLLGAGGAGTAIAFSLVQAGVSELAIHDGDVERRQSLIRRLSALGQANIIEGSDNPEGFDIVTNATPMGMKEGDPLPVHIDKLSAATFVSDVITVPAISPLIAHAREIGCATSTGIEMFNEVRDCMVEFLTGK